MHLEFKRFFNIFYLSKTVVFDRNFYTQYKLLLLVLVFTALSHKINNIYVKILLNIKIFYLIFKKLNFLKL
jgi:hypothetical protein